MERQDPRSGLSQHVVICNCNRKVRRIVAELQGSSQGPLDIVLLVQDAELWRQNPHWHPAEGAEGRFLVRFGCATNDDDLCGVNISEARAAVILADPRQGKLADPRSVLVAIAIERQNPQVHTVMELIASRSRIHVRSTEINEIICLGEISEKLIAQSCISPGVKQIFDHLLSSARDTNQIFIVPVSKGLVGQSFRQLARRAITRGLPFVLCGYALAPKSADEDAPGLLGGPPPRTFVLNPRGNVEPGKDTALGAEDELVVLAYERPDLEAVLAAD